MVEFQIDDGLPVEYWREFRGVRVGFSRHVCDQLEFLRNLLSDEYWDEDKYPYYNSERGGLVCILSKS